MEKTNRLLLAIGDEEIETQIRNIKEIEVIDSDPDIEIITDILNYETADFVIVNTVLSEEKSLALAKKAKEKSVKVIALIESHKNKEFIASLVGFGVRAFIQFDEIKKIADYIKNYPEEFDFLKLQKSNSKSTDKINREIHFEPLNLKGKITIGIFNICNGAGATTTAVELAESIAGNGKKVVCVELDSREDLKFINQKKCKATYYLPQISNLSQILNQLHCSNDYQYIIFDFGKVYDLDYDGELRSISINQEIFREFQRCNYKIGMAFSDVWHAGRLDYFTKCEEQLGDLSILISGLDLEGAISSYRNLDIYDRNHLDAFLEDFMSVLSITKSSHNVKKGVLRRIFNK